MAKQAGKTFNVTQAVGKKPDGKNIWKPHGRAFVRADLTGGVLWEGKGEEEKAYGLSPREAKPGAKGTTFDVKEKGAGSDAVHGRLFIRTDLSGGAYWVGSGDDEEEYAVFPHTPKPKAADEPVTTAGAVTAGAA